MSKDTEYNVKVKFIGDTKNLESSMDRVGKTSKKLERQAIITQKREVKHRRAIKKETEALRKYYERIEAPSLKRKNFVLQSQVKQMAAQTKELQKQHSWLAKIRNMIGGGGRGGGGVPGAPGGPGGPGGGPGGPGAHGGPGGGPGGRRRGVGVGMRFGRVGGFLRGLGFTAASLAAAGAGATIAMPFRAVGSDYQAYIAYTRGMAPLAGLARGMPFGAGARLGNLDGSDKGSVNAMAERLAKYGYMSDEVVRAAGVFGRATGSTRDTEYGLKAARGLGLDPNAIAAIFAEMRRAEGSFGAQGKRDFQRMMAAAVKSGVDASTLPEYFEGVTSMVDRAGGALGGSVSVLPYAQLLSLFEKSQFAGLKGARGASVASAIEEAIKRPGGGAEGTAIMMAAIGGFGRVGGMGSYYEAKKAMQMGFQGEGGASVIKNLFDYVDHISGGGQEANLLLEGLLGGRLTLDQIETVRKAIDQGKSGEDLQKVLKEMTASELDVLKKIEKNTSARAFLEASAHSAKILRQNIRRGAEFKDPIERMQDIIQKFLSAVQPLVTQVLKVTAGLMEKLQPLIDTHGKFIRKKWSINYSSTEGKAIKGAEMAIKALKAIEGNDKLSGEGRRLALDAIKKTLVKQQLQHVVDVAARGGEDSLQAFLGEMVSMREFDEWRKEQRWRQHGSLDNAVVRDLLRRELFRAEGTRRELRGQFAELLEALGERVPRSTFTREVRVDELMAVLRSVGINIPAGDRAEIDSRGGTQ